MNNMSNYFLDEEVETEYQACLRHKAALKEELRRINAFIGFFEYYKETGISDPDRFGIAEFLPEALDTDGEYA